MPFTIHPDQKPSDNEAYWRRYIEETENRAKAAAVDCHLHAENARTARLIGRG